MPSGRVKITQRDQEIVAIRAIIETPPERRIRLTPGIWAHLDSLRRKRRKRRNLLAAWWRRVVG